MVFAGVRQTARGAVRVQVRSLDIVHDVLRPCRTDCDQSDEQEEAKACHGWHSSESHSAAGLVERRPNSAGQIPRGAYSPVVKEDDPGGLPCHVVMDGDDEDLRPDSPHRHLRAGQLYLFYSAGCRARRVKL